MTDNVENIRMDEYLYSLPSERIAQQPVLPPEAAKLLVWKGSKAPICDSAFGNLEAWLPEGSTLVFNDTKVVPARVVLHKKSGARIEVFLLEPVAPKVYEEAMCSTSECEWQCLIGNAKKWSNEPLVRELAQGGLLSVTHQPSADGKAFIARFRWNNGQSFSAILQEVGQIPIPPYLNRETQAEDTLWYQTVYAHWEGSVAAPTAGLHFSQDMLNDLKKNRHDLLYTTLHVGAGTFLPVKSETIGGHVMHAERIVVHRTFLERLLATQGKIVAVGTTSLRSLESIYWYGALLRTNPDPTPDAVRQWTPYEQQESETRTCVLERLIAYLHRKGQEILELNTSLLIAPSYRLRMADGLITNFHQPGSTLLLLVSAIVGNDWQRIYAHALDSGYRFLSYGDGCILLPEQTEV